MDASDNFITWVRVSQSLIQQLQWCSINPMLPRLHYLVKILIMPPSILSLSLKDDDSGIIYIYIKRSYITNFIIYSHSFWDPQHYLFEKKNCSSCHLQSLELGHQNCRHRISQRIVHILHILEPCNHYKTSNVSMLQC
jgi:hypothetical protein